MSRKIFRGVLVIALASLLTPAALAQLTPYSQDFELLDQADPNALANDNWLVFANVFGPGGGFLYNYGPFVAPNGGPGFSGIDIGQGGLEQGDQQLVVYSDYNNVDHAVGNIIEANVYREQVISSADVGSTWVFAFDFKRGNIDGATTALAFIKTLDPSAGFALTNLVSADMTAVPDTWGTTLLSIYIDASLDGQLLQIGFASNATFYEGSGIFYDNINFINAEDLCPSDDADDEDDDEDAEGGGGNMSNRDLTSIFSSGNATQFNTNQSAAPTNERGERTRKAIGRR